MCLYPSHNTKYFTFHVVWPFTAYNQLFNQSDSRARQSMFI